MVRWKTSLCWTITSNRFSWSMLPSIWNGRMHKIWILQFHALETNIQRLEKVRFIAFQFYSKWCLQFRNYSRYLYSRRGGKSRSSRSRSRSPRKRSRERRERKEKERSRSRDRKGRYWIHVIQITKQTTHYFMFHQHIYITQCMK